MSKTRKYLHKEYLKKDRRWSFEDYLMVVRNSWRVRPTSNNFNLHNLINMRPHVDVKEYKNMLRYQYNKYYRSVYMKWYANQIFRGLYPR